MRYVCEFSFPHSPTMTSLGVTGGIGSGKSAACRIFEDLGARVVYADQVAKRLMHEDPALREQITDAFGPESYGADGHLNRAYLAQRVFGDEAEVQRLNALVHPRVRQEMLRLIGEAEHEGLPLLVYEAALIFEAGADAHLDAVAVVDAPLEVRIARVMERDAVPREAVLARMRHQFPPEELRRRADYVLDNGGDLAHLRTQVEALYRRLSAA